MLLNTQERDEKRHKNCRLNTAARKKDDEFYTQMKDIEAHLRNYEPYFKDLTVYLPCDNPKHSQFFKYFNENFQSLGLKGLIATHYRLQQDGPSTAFIRDKGDVKGITRPLRGYGDFRSPECLEFMEQADVVVTNPPFSLFGDMVDAVSSRDKPFILLGPITAIRRSNTLPLLINGQAWVDERACYRALDFLRPDGSTKELPVRWYCSLGPRYVHTPLKLTSRYRGNEESYPKIDGVDAIFVKSLKTIPKDYTGTMAVPLTIMGRLDPSQFTVVGYLEAPKIGGKRKYSRVLVRLNAIQS